MPDSQGQLAPLAPQKLNFCSPPGVLREIIFFTAMSKICHNLHFYLKKKKKGILLEDLHAWQGFMAHACSMSPQANSTVLLLIRARVSISIPMKPSRGPQICTFCQTRRVHYPTLWATKYNYVHVLLNLNEVKLSSLATTVKQWCKALLLVLPRGNFTNTLTQRPCGQAQALVGWRWVLNLVILWAGAHTLAP